MDARAAEPARASTMAALPDGVRALLERREDGMADAGGPFSPWCRREPGTFHARLLSAEVGPDTVLVGYERGGIAGPLIHHVEFTREADTWIEVVRPARLTWSGKQRRFGQVAATPSPPAPSPP